MNLKELDEKATRSYEGYRKRVEKIEAQIKTLNKRNERLKWTNLVEKNTDTTLKGGFIKPIAEIIKKKLGAKTIAVYGAFGLASETTLYWLKEGSDICQEGNVLGSLAIIHEGNHHAIRNEKKKVHNYAEGSIAEMNGFNYETIEITDKMNIKWLVNFVKRQR